MIRRTTNIILAIVTLLSFSSVQAQLVHFSDYSHAPLILSPALAGAYHGSVRIGSTFREQYRDFIDEPYQTSSIFIDSPLALGLPENQWIGLGVNLNKTEAGDLSLQEVSTRLGLSYHLALDKKNNTVVGVGVQYNLQARNIKNPENARFEDQLNGVVTVSEDQELIGNYEPSYSGLNAGAYIKMKFNKRVRFEGGLGIDNVTSVTFKTANSAAVNSIPLRYNVYGNWHYRASKKIILNPSFVFQRYGPVTNLLGVVGIRQLYSKEKNIILSYRLGYRLRDAGFVGVGAEFKNYSIALTYDLTVSSARNYNSSGALELGFSKIFIIHPRIKKKIIEICPRL